MAKPMIIIAHVEEAAFGKVWRTLDNMPGVAKLELHSEAKHPPTKKNGEPDHRHSWRKPGGFNMRMSTLEMLCKGPTTVDQLKELATSNGRTEHAISSATQNLTKRGLAKTNGKGIWNATAKGKTFLKSWKEDGK